MYRTTPMRGRFITIIIQHQPVERRAPVSTVPRSTLRRPRHGHPRPSVDVAGWQGEDSGGTRGEKNKAPSKAQLRTHIKKLAQTRRIPPNILMQPPVESDEYARGEAVDAANNSPARPPPHMPPT